MGAPTISLRPSHKLTAPPKTSHLDLYREFRFSPKPIVVNVATPPPSDIDSGDETDPEDHEARIRSSWHHRALLGDETRILYTDFLDTDFEQVEQTSNEMPEDD